MTHFVKSLLYIEKMQNDTAFFQMMIDYSFAQICYIPLWILSDAKELLIFLHMHPVLVFRNTFLNNLDKMGSKLICL